MDIVLFIKIFWTIFAIVFSFLYWINFVRLFFIERKIKNLYKEQDRIIKEVRANPISNNLIEGKIKKTKRDYAELLTPLKRKRRYILDKMPLMK